MTKQEFESIIAKANLSAEKNEQLFDVVNNALALVETLKQFDGDANEQN